jgi:hypothetical protein
MALPDPQNCGEPISDSWLFRADGVSEAGAPVYTARKDL